MNMQALLMSDDPGRTLWELFNSGELREFEPSLQALHMPIPKGYHHKDNFDHSIRVLNRAIEREGDKPDLLLRTAALFHDVGKPATRKFEKNGVVTFWNHETVGSRQVRKILAGHGYSKRQIETISRLVALHMRAYGFSDTVWTDSAVRRLARDAGSDDALDKLLVLFVSDLTTKNDRKRRKIESGISRLGEAIQVVREKDERAAERPALDGYELMELTGLGQGRELGQMMRVLNQDDNIKLERAEALALLKNKFPEYF